MPLTADNVARVGRGGASTSNTSTAIVVSLDSGSTDADSVVFVGLVGEGLTFATPSGWAVVGTPGSGLSVYRRGPVEGLAAAESSWNFTPSATAGKAVVAFALDMTGIDPNSTIDIASVVGTTTAGTTSISQTPSDVTTYDGLVVAVWGHRDNANATPATFSGYTNSFAEIFEQGQAGTGNSVDIAVAVLPSLTIRSYSSTATASRTLTSGAPAVTAMFVINAVGARKVTDLFWIDGNEQGTTTGNTVNTTPTLGALGGQWRQWASLSAGVSITTGSARSGTYGMELTSTSAACTAITDPFVAAKTGPYPTFKRAFDFNGSIGPARSLFAVTCFDSIGAQVSAIVSLRSDGYLGMVVAGGTEIVSDQQPPADGYWAVEVRMDSRARPSWTADWWIDYDASLTDATPAVAQIAATGTSGALSNVFGFRVQIGWVESVTASMFSDDGGGAGGQNAPIGDLRVIPLPVDPAGTITVTTSTNFGTMLNGSITAWNATTARGAIDDIPPTTGASRDALVALVASTTDHAKIPLSSYDLAANKVSARGFKAMMPLWAVSATAATCRVSIYDGTTAHPLYAEADPNADNAATPAWICGMLRPAAAPTTWTQAIVDNLQVWFGSNDATPDIGIEMVVGELAVVKALPENLFGEAGEPIYVEAHRDPDTLALVGATVNNNSGDPIKLAWEVDGTPSETASIPDGTAGMYVPLSADGSIETVNWVSVIPG